MLEEGTPYFYLRSRRGIKIEKEQKATTNTQRHPFETKRTREHIHIKPHTTQPNQVHPAKAEKHGGKMFFIVALSPVLSEYLHYYRIFALEPLIREGNMFAIINYMQGIDYAIVY